MAARARFCSGGFIFMPACLAACLPRRGGCNHHLASRKKPTADSILSRDSFNYHLVLKQQPSAISPTRLLPRSHRRMVDEVIWMMQWLRNGRCPPNGAKL